MAANVRSQEPDYRGMIGIIPDFFPVVVVLPPFLPLLAG
jgi:hypothetical protein